MNPATGRRLVNCRPVGTPSAGSWESPGGERQPDEAPLAALTRELDEELGIEVLEAEPVLALVHDYPDKRELQLLEADWPIVDGLAVLEPVARPDAAE
jgi:8-oxo-dGTP pyrophosphatase MutT (NUDIX family)